jgi:hypothetical protein
LSVYPKAILSLRSLGFAMALRRSVSRASAPLPDNVDDVVATPSADGDIKSISKPTTEPDESIDHSLSLCDAVPPTSNASPNGPTTTQSTSPEAAQKLSGPAIAVVMMPLCLSVFLSALDLTIVTPAIPAIVSSFKSVTGYVWIGSAFILTSTAVTPIFGAVADIWGRKPIILIALSVFLGGSLLCALAPQMDALIAGRAIQGLGSSGMGTMVNIIICDTFSLRDRGLYLAITSLVWAIGSAVGPVIGGSFTTRLR